MPNIGSVEVVAGHRLAPGPPIFLPAQTPICLNIPIRTGQKILKIDVGFSRNIVTCLCRLYK